MAKKKEFVQNNNNYAIAYYRFSSHAQNEASIDQQREQAHAYAREHDLKIIKEYEDAAISGTRDDRPGFQLMLAEIGKLRPSTLILWKTDRLARDRYVLTMAKKKVRDAGCCINYVAEINPTDSPESALLESLMEGMAEFYSLQLQQNVVRGMRYNAEHCLYNGHKLLGYGVDSEKRYIRDPNTAPIVERIFLEYAGGKPMSQIAADLNKQGIKTTTGGDFNINGLRHILKNPAYIGTYRYGDIIIKDGMPRLITDELYNAVQERFEKNKHKKTMNPELADAPRFWLTGKVFCGHCGTSIHGMGGTSHTGKLHYYYACKNQRKGKCNLKSIKKDVLEAHVIWALKELLNDSENLASLAVDIGRYYHELNDNEDLINALKAELREVEKGIGNLVKVLEKGVISDTITERLQKLEEQKDDLKGAIERERLKQALVSDNKLIQKYFEKFSNSDLSDEETRNNVMEYFVDKIYVYNNRIVITWFYSEDATEMSLDTLTEISKPKARGKKSRENRENDDSGLDEKGSLLMRLSPLGKKQRCLYIIYSIAVFVYKRI